MAIMGLRLSSIFPTRAEINVVDTPVIYESTVMNATAHSQLPLIMELDGEHCANSLQANITLLLIVQVRR